VSPNSEISKYYRDQAAECEALARTTQSVRTREIMLEMAMRWNAFADEHEGKAPCAPIDGWPLRLFR
jgi:hypothetical protein